MANFIDNFFGGGSSGGPTPAGLLGGAVSDLTGAAGGLSEASAYSKAAQIATTNEALATESANLQEYALNRQAYQTISAQKSQIAGAGFAQGGSALDLARSSQQQANLAQGVTKIQGEITAGGFAQQAAAYEGQAAAAKAQAGGGIFGGLLKGAAAIFGL